MGIFRRKSKRPKRDAADLPRDSALALLSETEAAFLRSRVREAFAEQGLEVTMGPAHVTDSTGRRFGLANLAATCHHDRRGTRAWPLLVRDHVDKILRSVDGPDVLTTMPRERLLARLFPRIVGIDMAHLDGGYAYGPELTPDLLEVLALDLPETVQVLNERGLATLGEPAPLRVRALANLRRIPVKRHRTVTEDDGARFHVLEGESYFLPSLVLLLDEVAPVYEEAELGPEGALVAMPFRHQFAFHVITGRSVVPTLNAMARFAATGFAQSPGAVSPSVYWWRAGTLTRLTAAEGQTIRVDVDLDFQQLLERLTDN